MHYISIFMITLFLGSSSLYAQKPDADTFFYNKGFSDGKAEGMRLGYAKAKKEIMKKLKSRLRTIKAMEAGKYLSKKHKITAPQIYQVRNSDGSLSVQVKGCRLEGELTTEEIVLLPKVEEGYISDAPARNLVSSTSMPKEKSVGLSDGVFMPGIDAAQYTKPTMASNVTQAVYKYLPNTSFYVNLLRTSGFPFTVTNGGSHLKVRFSSSSEAIGFLRRYELQPGRDMK